MPLRFVRPRRECPGGENDLRTRSPAPSHLSYLAQCEPLRRFRSAIKPLVITGGYAVQAHQLVDRPSRDLDVATDSDTPMEDIAAALVVGLTARGWDMHIVGVDPRSARMTATRAYLDADNEHYVK